MAEIATSMGTDERGQTKGLPWPAGIVSVRVALAQALTTNAEQQSVAGRGGADRSVAVRGGSLCSLDRSTGRSA